MKTKLIAVNRSVRFRGPYVISGSTGRLHSGFAEEAVRISSRIIDAMRDAKLGDFDYVFLTGHSLGGAVAAISENILKLGPTSVCILGAPRYGDVTYYIGHDVGPPCQIRRPGDIVPTIPPRFMGYADHPYEFHTDGSVYIDQTAYPMPIRGFIRWAGFLSGRFAPHAVEGYRRELGLAAGSAGANLPLVVENNLNASLAT